jgi:hypothetical protein
MNDQGTSNNINERYALARHGLPLAGRIATPMRAHWLPASIKNPIKAAQMSAIAAPDARDFAPDANGVDIGWDMEISELNVGDDEQSLLVSSSAATDAADASAAILTSSARGSTITSNRLTNSDFSASGSLSSEQHGLATDDSIAVDNRNDIASKGAFENDKDDIGAVATHSARQRINDGTRADAADGPHAVLSADDMPSLRSTSIDGVRRKGRITAAESTDAARTETLIKLSANDDGVSGDVATASSNVATYPKATKPLDGATATTSLESKATSQSVRSNIANISDTTRPANAEQGNRARQWSSADESGQAGKPPPASDSQSISPQVRMVEMGLPMETPTHRDYHRAPFRAPPSSPTIDAARIASLLAPVASTTGPSVTIDRVQVTVQAPPSAKPGSNGVQSSMPSPQSSTMSRAHSNASSYRSPWASYFTRRD